MTRPQPPELFTSERPIRSDFARGDVGRERVYARRRKITIAVLVLVLAGGAYVAWSRRPVSLADIPTIKAVGDYRQKPADPGGIDIPHQDMHVYDQLEGKGAPAPQIEHLLPPPEVPKESPRVTDAPTMTAPTTAPPPLAIIPTKKANDIVSAPASAPVITTATQPAAPAPSPAKLAAVEAQPIAPPAPASVATPQPTIEQIIAKTVTPSKNTSATALTAAAGSVMAQLASLPDQAKAQAMLQDLQTKYATQLNGVALHLTRADLGGRGIFYRIQTTALSDGDANRLCSALKQAKAGCILVRP